MRTSKMTGSLADAACGTLTETSGSVPPPLMTAVVGAFALYFALNSSNTFCSVAVNSPPASSLKKAGSLKRVGEIYAAVRYGPSDAASAERIAALRAGIAGLPSARRMRS